MAHMVSVDWRIYEYQVPGNVTNTLSLANDLHDFYGNPHQPWDDWTRIFFLRFAYLAYFLEKLIIKKNLQRNGDR